MSTVKSYKIFISSTFKDMDAERDLVINVLKPKLEQQLQSECVTASVEIIDLRWGVNTQDVAEEERENKVLNECLENIRNSKPFFIGFIGDRYGWIPSQERWQHVLEGMTAKEREMMKDEAEEVRSVTELEILFGVLQDRSCMPNSFFFMRRPGVYDSIPADKKSIYCDSDPKARHKLDTLKDKVLTAYSQAGLTGNIYEYDGVWCGDRLMLQEDLLNDAIEKIVKSILFINDQDEAEFTELDNLIDNDQKLLTERNSYFAGREQELSALTNYIQIAKTPLVVLADDGTGKTSLLSQLYAQLSSNEQYFPLIHFTTYKGPQSYAEVMLKKWLWQIDESFDFRRPIQMEAAPAMLFFWLRTVAHRSKKKLVLLIDDMQYLQGFENILDFKGVGEDYAVIITSSRPFAHFVDGKNATYMTLPALKPADSLLLIDRYMASYHKTLPREVVQAIAQKRDDEGQLAFTRPLWTVLLLSQLASLDWNDFQTLRNMDVADEAEKITRFLYKKVTEASPVVYDYLADIIEGCTTDQNIDLIKAILSLLRDGRLSYENVCQRLNRATDRMDYLNVMQNIAPMVRIADSSGYAQTSYTILLGEKMLETVVGEPVDFQRWMGFVHYTTLQLLRLSKIYNEEGRTQMSVAAYEEARQNFTCFNQDFAVKMIEESRLNPMPWEVKFSEMQHMAKSTAFGEAYDAWIKQPSWENKLMVQVAYLNWCSWLELETDMTIRSQKDALPVETLITYMERLGKAYLAISVLRGRNLLSYLADYFFCSSQERIAKNITGSQKESRHYAALKEKAAMLMYTISPKSKAFMRQYANSLDENAILVPQAAETKLGKSMRLYAELFHAEKNEENLQNYLGSASQMVAILNMNNCFDAAIDQCNQMQKLAEAYPDFNTDRVMGIAMDYVSISYFNKGDIDNALNAVMSARQFFLADLKTHPDSLVTIHSLAEVSKRVIDMKMKKSVMSEDDINELENWAYKPLEKFPNDFKSHSMLMQAKLYRMCHCAYTNHAESVPEMAAEAFSMVINIMRNGLRYTMLSLDQIASTAEGLRTTGCTEIYNQFMQLVVQLREILISERLIPVDFFERLLAEYKPLPPEANLDMASEEETEDEGTDDSTEIPAELQEEWEKYNKRMTDQESKNPTDAIHLASVCEKMNDYKQGAIWYMYSLLCGLPQDAKSLFLLSRFMFRWYKSWHYPAFSDAEGELIPAIGFTLASILHDFFPDELDGASFYLFSLYCMEGVGIEKCPELAYMNCSFALTKNCELEDPELDPLIDDEEQEQEEIPQLTEGECVNTLADTLHSLYDIAEKNNSPLMAYCRKMLKPLCKKYPIPEE